MLTNTSNERAQPRAANDTLAPPTMSDADWTLALQDCLNFHTKLSNILLEEITRNSKSIERRKDIPHALSLLKMGISRPAEESIQQGDAEARSMLHKAGETISVIQGIECEELAKAMTFQEESRYLYQECMKQSNNLHYLILESAARARHPKSVDVMESKLEELRRGYQYFQQHKHEISARIAQTQAHLAMMINRNLATIAADRYLQDD